MTQSEDLILEYMRKGAKLFSRSSPPPVSAWLQFDNGEQGVLVYQDFRSLADREEIKFLSTLPNGNTEWELRAVEVSETPPVPEQPTLAPVPEQTPETPETTPSQPVPEPETNTIGNGSLSIIIAIVIIVVILFVLFRIFSN